jgi:AAA domain
MKFLLKSLTLQCRQSREVIEFSRQVSFFHGKIAAGKSSILRLIDFCLGGDLERTPAIIKELVSVEMSACIGEYNVLFERDQGSNQVQVTWQGENESATVLAAINSDASRPPIWGTDIFYLSDLVFYLAGSSILRVRKNQNNPDAPFVRLSFRDILWYCYLDQDNLDSSFYRLEEPIIQSKSRNVMRFIVGFYTERLSDLETRLSDIKKQRSGKREAINQIRTFIQEFGYASESDISQETQAIEQEVSEFYSLQTSLRQGYIVNTHFVDELRQSLRNLSNCLAQEEQTLTDLYSEIEEKEALRADLLSAKLKVARSSSANALLSGVAFDSCPACGTKVNNPSYPEEDSCYLCGRCPHHNEEFSQMNEVLKKDLISRILELEESIFSHKKSIKGQTRRTEELRQEKTRLDRQLVQELSNYDSAFLAESREVDWQVATLEERLRGLQRISSMITGLERLEHELHELRVSEEELEEQIQREREGLTNADQNIRDIENAYLDALIQSKVPGINQHDKIEINRKTWIPWILSESDEALKWYFSNAGSGGKKTLLKVCYALALHKVAADNNLPLPSLLIIDTPMKNIGEDVNNDIFESFYNYVYALSETSLSDTQIIIVDKEYFSPASYEIDYYERYMTPNETEHPPLITYYRGS